eukprot:scaffold2063_cov401-Prasinococcus_capsulatus_cf.AAC.22
MAACTQVVFDLDNTAWTPEMYELRGGSPFTKDEKTGIVRDWTGEQVQLFPAAREALAEIVSHSEWEGTQVAVASRTTHTSWARECMSLLEVLPGVTMDEVETSSLLRGAVQEDIPRIQEEALSRAA